MLLILAGVSLSAVFSEKGIFSRAEKAGNKYNEAKAREVLETVLLADGQYEKHTNPKYNQDDFLDDLIKSQIEGSDVKGDVAIIGDYAFELDRSVPKIGRYLGLAKDLVFPTVEATVKLADDKKDATITITASEEKNGINKIEIWLLGEKIDEFSYENIKTEITLPYTATQNGKYTIKAYGYLMASTMATVEGIVPEIEFEPNGSTEWKKEHSTKITVKETKEKIKSMKFQWTNSVIEPADESFTENCKDGEIISKNKITGTYYLWVWLETENGATAKRRSEGFNFDNKGPSGRASWSTKTENSINIKVTEFSDEMSGVSHCDIYVDDKYLGKIESENGLGELTTNQAMGYHKIQIKLYDKAGNISNITFNSARTLMHKWEKYECIASERYFDYATKATLGGDTAIQGGGLFLGTVYVYQDYKYYIKSGTVELSNWTGYMFTNSNFSSLKGKWTDPNNPFKTKGDSKTATFESAFLIQDIIFYEDRKL